MLSSFLDNKAVVPLDNLDVTVTFLNSINTSWSIKARHLTRNSRTSLVLPAASSFPHALFARNSSNGELANGSSLESPIYNSHSRIPVKSAVGQVFNSKQYMKLQTSPLSALSCRNFSNLIWTKSPTMV